MENTKPQARDTIEANIRAWNVAAQENIDRHLHGLPAKATAVTRDRVIKGAGSSFQKPNLPLHDRAVGNLSLTTAGPSGDPSSGDQGNANPNASKGPGEIATSPLVYNAPDRIPPHLRIPGSGTSTPSYSDVTATNCKPVASNPTPQPSRIQGHSQSVIPELTEQSQATQKKRKPAPSMPNDDVKIAEKRHQLTQSVKTEEIQEHSTKSKPMNSGKAAKSAKIDSPFPCSYTDCTMGFKKLQELRVHKDKEHEWCSRCDADCKDWDDLVSHRIHSPRHIACQFCGEDFKSEAGKNRHERQSHPPEHRIKCIGCGAIFGKASALIAHAWGECRSKEVSENRLRENRARAALHLDRLAHEKVAEHLSMWQSETESVTGSSTTGGVPLERSILDSDIPESVGYGASTIGEVPDNNGYGQKRGGAAEDLLESLEDISLEPEKKKPAPSTPTWSKKLFPDVMPTPMSSFHTPTKPSYHHGRGGVASSANSQYSQETKMKTDWDHEKFERDPLDGKFKCPFQRCSLRVEDLDFLKIHLSAGFHAGTDHRCIKCLKVFGSVVALMAHMESGSERCRIRDTQRFGHVVHIVSGGFLGVEGKDERGFSVIKEVPNPQADQPRLEEADNIEPEFPWD